MKSKKSKTQHLQEYLVIYQDKSQWVLWLPKNMRASMVRACIEQDAAVAGQKVAAIKVIAADGTLSFLKK